MRVVFFRRKLWWPVQRPTGDAKINRTGGFVHVWTHECVCYVRVLQTARTGRLGLFSRRAHTPVMLSYDLCWALGRRVQRLSVQKGKFGLGIKTWPQNGPLNPQSSHESLNESVLVSWNLNVSALSVTVNGILGKLRLKLTALYSRLTLISELFDMNDYSPKKHSSVWVYSHSCFFKKVWNTKDSVGKNLVGFSTQWKWTGAVKLQ